MSTNKRSRLSVKQKRFLKAFESALGNVSKAADEIKINRGTYYLWMNTNELFKQKVEEIENKNIDFAETMLLKNIRDGKESSIFFYLKCKGKDRGYIEKQEIGVTNKQGEDVPVGSVTYVFGNNDFVDQFAKKIEGETKADESTN
jgi:hypothetical protein